MRSPETPSSEWITSRVEAYLDQALPAAEKAAFEEAITDDPFWEDELLLAQKIRHGLRTLPVPGCPPHVTAAILAQTSQARSLSLSGRWRQWLEAQWLTLWQPALAMALLVALVTSVTVWNRAPSSEAEIARARAEVQWTLAYLSDVSRRTGQTVRHDVIEARVVKPMTNALQQP